MSGSKSSSSTLYGSRLGTLVLALGLTAPPAVLLAAPASAAPEVTATPLESSCGVALAFRGFPAGPHHVRLSITPADGAALQVQDEGRLTVSGGAPRSVEVTATPAEGRGPYEVLVTVDDVAQPKADLALPECAAAASAGASPSASPAGASPSPPAASPSSSPAAASPSSSPAADESPSPTTGSPSPVASATPSATPATASPDAAGAPSPTTSPTVAAEQSAGEASSVAAPGGQEQPVVAAAPEASAPAPAVLAGSASSGLVPLGALAAPATGAPSSVAAVTVPVVAPLPLTAPPALPVPLAAPPVVALPEGAAGPLLATGPVPAFDALLPQLPLRPEPVPGADSGLAAVPQAAAPDVPPPGIAEALPGALLLAGLVGVRARRRRLA